MKRTILLVGSSSPMGRVIAAELEGRAHDVTRASRSGADGSERLDVTNPSLAEDLVGRVGPTSVVYLARPDLEHVADTNEAIVSAVAALSRFATRCAEQGVERLIFASSAAVYGTRATAPRRESDPTDGDSPYALLKLRSEDALARVGTATALSTLSLRVFNVYGPGFGNSLVNRLALNYGPTPVVHNTDRFVRDYIHVADVARAFADAVEAPELGATNLNLGTGIGTSNRMLLSWRPDSAHREHPDSGIQSFSIADVSRLRRLLSFEPRIAVRDAMRAPESFFL